MENPSDAKSKGVKVRIPPSPTGYMHIGSVRMALFNYLFAKQSKGTIVLRLEDTDKERSKPEFAKDILDGLKWLGIIWDDGPYYQSQRMEIYARYLKKLLDEDTAYCCFCSQVELEAQKQDQMSRGDPAVYRGKCAALSKEEAEKLIREGKKPVIRFRTKIKKIQFNDLVKGTIEFDSALIGDFVIAKDLNNALYNFTVVVDDIEMDITHVIRGEDHLSNTPKQILIQEALGFKMPKYAHLPIVMGPDRAKLSKRHGAVAISEYRKNGYLPEAIINFTAFLGWNPGTDKEIYSIEELIKDFSLEKVQKGGAMFNVKRLDFLNGFYIRQMPAEELTKLCLPYFIESGVIEESGRESNKYFIKATGEGIDFDFLKKIVLYHQQRLKKLSEINELANYFFSDKLTYEKDLLKWKDAGRNDIELALDESRNLFYKIEEANWTKENLEKIILTAAEEFSKKINKTEWDRGYLLWPLRASLCGKKMSIGPFEMAEVLGKEKTLKRIQDAINLLQ